jgi:hypothetical protein
MFLSWSSANFQKGEFLMEKKLSPRLKPQINFGTCQVGRTALAFQSRPDILRPKIAQKSLNRSKIAQKLLKNRSKIAQKLLKNRSKICFYQLPKRA